MSYLTPPRLTFAGQSYANASTANNNDIAGLYDIDQMTLNPSIGLMTGGTIVQPTAPQPPLANPFPWSGSADNPALRTWLMGLMKADGVDSIGMAQMAHWNYFGEHSTEFRQTTVTNGDLSTGAVAATDPILGAQAQILGDVFYGRRRGGVLVDVDPYALPTSQVFSGRFQLTYQPSGGSAIPLITGDHPTVAYSYFINPYKNLNPSCTGFEPVSAVFQFGLPLQHLSFYSGSDVISPALVEVQARAQGTLGLMVRFCLYDAIFQIEAPALNADFTAGNYVMNPYIGRVLGSIGIWNAGELPSAPVGRKLRVQIPYTYTPPPPDLSPGEMAAKQQRMATVAKYLVREKKPGAATTTKQANLGITLAQVDTTRQVVALDCISTFPEANITQRDKFDLGPVNLVLLYGTPTSPGGPPPNSVTIGPVPYDKATYESGGGVVEICYANNPARSTIAANLATGLLALNSTTLATNLLIETPDIDTQSANRAVYFDCKVGAGASAVPGTSQIAIQVLRHGVAPTTATTLNLEYWMCAKNYINPDKPQVPVPSRYFSVADATSLPPTAYTLGFLKGLYPPAGQVTVITDQITVPAGGQLTLNLTAIRPGVSMIRFVDPSISPPPPPNFAWDNTDFATVRILPFNDYSGYTDAQINPWPFIYDNFFGFYSVLYPVMANVIPWGPNGAPNDPATVKTFATQMLALTDPAMWGSTIYMPITRDLSGGKRELLVRWCNLQLANPS